MVTYGYRIGMLVAGAGVFFLADFWTWTHAYLIMASLILLSAVLVSFAKEPSISSGEYFFESVKKLGKIASLSRWLGKFILAPFSEFATRPGWLLTLLFIVTFKLGDAFLSTLSTPFYIDLGFTKTEIAEVTKLFGL